MPQTHKLLQPQPTTKRLTLRQLDFTAIIEMENIIYVFAEVLEILALLKLRRDHPNAPRAWQIPVQSQW